MITCELNGQGFKNKRDLLGLELAGKSLFMKTKFLMYELIRWLWL